MYANNLETKCAYITLIAVKPECQHNGIGGQLLKKCETTAIEKGMDKIRLEVLKGFQLPEYLEIKGIAKGYLMQTKNGENNNC